MSAGMPGDGFDSYGGFDCWIHCFTRRIASCRLDVLAYALAHSLRFEDVRYPHSLASLASFPLLDSLLSFSLSIFPSLSRRSLILTLKLSISRRRIASLITFESECTRDSSITWLLLLLGPICRCSLATARFKEGTTGLDRGASRGARLEPPADGAGASRGSLPSAPRTDATGSSPPMSYLEPRAAGCLANRCLSLEFSNFTLFTYSLAWRWWWARGRPHTWWL